VSFLIYRVPIYGNKELTLNLSIRVGLLGVQAVDVVWD